MGLKIEFEKTMREKFIGDFVDPSSNKGIFLERVFLPLLAKISGVANYEKICDEKLSNLSVANPEDLNVIFKNLNLNSKIYLNKFDLNKQYIVVCNHPTGPLDGLFIQKVFHILGIKGKLLGDDIMTGLKQMKDAYIGLSTRIGGKSRISQLRALKKEIKNGHSLALFPAGSVSHFDLKQKKICEYKWNLGFIEIAKSNNLDILPVYIDANLSVWHYFFKFIYSDIASLRLFRESKKFIDRNQGNYINIYIGNPIEVSDLDATKENASKIQNICENLKYQTYTHIE